jgi:hypothetical protein
MSKQGPPKLEQEIESWRKRYTVWKAANHES